METIRKFAQLIEGRRNRWLALAVFAGGVSALDAAAAALVFALFQTLTAPEHGLQLPVVGDVARFTPDLDASELLLLGGVVVAAVFVVRSAAYLVLKYLEHRVAENTGVQISRRLVEGYLNMPYAYHLNRNSAELVRNAYEASQRIVAQVFIPALRALSEGLIVFAIVVVLVATAPALTGLAILVFTPSILTLLKVLQPRLKRLGRIGQDMAHTSLQSLQQAFGGLRDIKLLGREAFFVDDFVHHRRRRARAYYVSGFARELPRITLETVLVLSIAASLVVAVVNGRSPTELIAVLGLFGYAAFRAIPSLSRVVAQLNTLKFAAATVHDLHTDLELFRLQCSTPSQEPIEKLPFRSDIVFQDVSFRYEGSSTDALRDIALLIPKGSSLGLVGPTGGGKTTLLDLIVGLLEPNSGAVLVDGVDIRTDPRSWQRNVGVVHQNTFLLDDTLRRNIALGVPEREIDEGLLRTAVELAQLKDFVNTLLDDLDTFVGERGVRLSGGQRQRVGIARALYHQPEVLVFDEATSALDNSTERILFEQLRRILTDQTTLLMVAHRISTVRECDQILVLRGGRTVAKGTYDELLAGDTTFRQLVTGVTSGGNLSSD